MWWRAGVVGAGLLWSTLSLADPSAPSDTPDWYAFRSFGTLDGLPHNGILTLAQDAEGWIHAGTAQGLARDEGGRWVAVPLPGPVPDPAVGALLRTADGAFWVGTDSGLFRRQGAQFDAVPLPSPQSVTALAEAPDGAVWVGSLSGLFRCQTQCTEFHALAPQGVRALLHEVGADGERLWIGGNGDGLRLLGAPFTADPPRVLQHYTRTHGLPNAVVLALRRHRDALWIGTGRGLARLDGTGLTRLGPRVGVPEAMVFALQPWTGADGVERLLVTLRPGGVLAVAPDGHWRLLDARQGLPVNAPQALLVEQQRGGLWIGSWDAGVARIEANRWALFDESEGLPSRLVQSVGWSAPSGTLWAGTAAGPAVWQAGRFLPLGPAELASLQLNALLELADGSRWLAHSRGLEHSQDGRRVAAYSVDGGILPGLAVHQLASLEEADGVAIYAGTSHGLTRWTASTGLQRVQGIDGVPDDASAGTFRVATSVGRDVALWMIRSGRLTRRQDGAWRVMAPDCIAGQPIQALEVEAAEVGGRRWLGTRRGLYELSGEDCRAWPATDGLGGIVHLRRTPQGLYVFGARGALRLDPDGDPAQGGWPQTAADGLPRPDVAASAVDARGRLYVASSSGIAAYEAAPPRAAHAAPLRLLQASGGEPARPLQPGTRLPAAAGTVSFRYTLLTHEREHATRYRFQLQGLDAVPGDWRSTGEISYPRLPPGRYTLRVEAHDADGTAAEPAQFAFEVARPYWQHPLALLLGAGGLVGLGLAAGRWRTRALKRRAERLAREVAARTAELAAANLRLEQASLTDPLTGLHNRRYYTQLATEEAARARRAGTGSVLVVLLDIDHFKRINDQHGHDAGDAVLVEIAARLRQLARSGDLVMRWGGEEFLLLLRDTEATAATALLQRLLQGLSDAPIRLPDAGMLAVSVSAGAIGFPDADGVLGDLSAAITAADAALYRAKRHGRDRAVLLRHAAAVDAAEMLPRKSTDRVDP
ncbi:MAG: diguanylate cyclase [Xanthomonadales bacterium]|jgi:diguanylate cyclase (GGDEF)-like protein|nr:diguanylate cyclase [Xanthomonadales bacterium]